MNDKFVLNTNDLFLAQDKNIAYKVTEGSIIVFLVPVINGAMGRRKLMLTAEKGDIIPSLDASLAITRQDEPCRWVFALSPLSKSVMEEVLNTDEICSSFARKAGVFSVDILGFEKSIVDLYRQTLAEDAENIRAAESQRKEAYRGSLEVIYNLFKKEKIRKVKAMSERTGNALYDAAAVLCSWQKIDIEQYDIIKSNCGEFTVKDIARLSGFICRDIMLEEDWFKNDAGPILAFKADGNKAVVCLPVSSRKYIIWDPEDGSVTPLTKSVAAGLKPQAAMFYRPFPKKKMNIKSVMGFAMKDLCVGDVISIIVFTLIGTLIGLLLPMLNEQMYDVLIPMGDRQGIIDICMVVFACTVGNISFSVVKNFSGFRFLSRMKYSVQAAVIDRLFNLPESFYRGHESADLGERAMGISQIFSILASSLVGVGLTAVFSIVYAVRMFFYSGELSGTSLLMLIPAMLVVLLIGWLQIRHEKKLLEKSGEISSTMFQLLSGISKLRMAGAEDRALYEYMRKYTDECAIGVKIEKYSLAGNIISGVISTLFSVVIYYVMINGGINLSMGEFMGFSTAFGAFSGAMMQIVGAYLQLNAIGPALERMKPILETMPEQTEDSVMPGDITGDIEVSNVTFAYDEESPAVLKDISVHIKAGEYVGVVGSSGCGKSTLLKLLLGFEKPQEGRIYYDGKDIDTVDKRELRKRFGVVLQDGGLITGSIYDNITITKPGATMDEVKAAVKDAGLEKDISQLPMGMHTLLSEGDGSISGGQRQRVLIARAIVGKPKVIYFDEATSALDNATQASVCESLESLDSTRVVIAHRLSTIIKCDRILVMDNGSIAEQGTFDELMAKKGIFYRLASRQLS